MNYNLMAKLMPLMMNKIIFDYLKSDGVKVDFAFKKKCKSEYKKNRGSYTGTRKRQQPASYALHWLLSNFFLQGFPRYNYRTPL